jgi:CBS domain-containing protein
MKLIKEVMSDNVKCVDPETSIRDVAVLMRDMDVGAIPVCENDRIAGIVTDRDIVVKTLTGEMSPEGASARDVMSSPIVFCFEDEDIGEAARLMEVNQIRRLAVLNHDKRLVGIVSLGDISVMGHENLSGEILQKVSEPPEDRLSA